VTAVAEYFDATRWQTSATATTANKSKLKPPFIVKLFAVNVTAVLVTVTAGNGR
jgi:hypothetical protein